MSDQNPYQPAPEIDEPPIQPQMFFRRLAAVSSAVGTALIGVALLSLWMTLRDFDAGLLANLANVHLYAAMGIGLILAGYYWYGGEVNLAVFWNLFSVMLFAIAVLFDS